MGSDGGRVHVGVMRVDVYLPGADSLKAKRSLLNKAKAALRNDLEVSVAEIGWQELWQRASLGIAVAASSHGGADHVLDQVIRIIERDPRVVVTGAVSEIGGLDAGAFDVPMGFE